MKQVIDYRFGDQYEVPFMELRDKRGNKKLFVYVFTRYTIEDCTPYYTLHIVNQCQMRLHLIDRIIHILN